MMAELIFRNLWHRPARTLIGVIAIAWKSHWSF
jgi:hypothetical protein